MAYLLWKQYSQHLIFFITYKWAQQARLFVPGKPFPPSVMQHYVLLNPFASYRENKVF
jgi:hypothetical protein